MGRLPDGADGEVGVVGGVDVADELPLEREQVLERIRRVRVQVRLRDAQRQRACVDELIDLCGRAARAALGAPVGVGAVVAAEHRDAHEPERRVEEVPYHVRLKFPIS